MGQIRVEVFNPFDQSIKQVVSTRLPHDLVMIR